MGARIDQFCEDLRQKLTMPTAAWMAGKDQRQGGTRRAGRAEPSRQGPQACRARPRQDRGCSSRHQRVGRQKKAATSDKIAEWKAKRELTKLQGRANKAERYAAAASAVAVAALDEAEEASLEAWLARQDANSAQAQ